MGPGKIPGQCGLLGIKKEEEPMKHAKKIEKTLIAVMLALVLALSGCASGSGNEAGQASGQEETSSEGGEGSEELRELQEKVASLEAAVEALTGGCYAYESYRYMQYIDAELSERDCYKGENFKQTQEWIRSELLSAGYGEEDIVFQDVVHTIYVSRVGDPSELYTQVDHLTVDESARYKRNGDTFREDPAGTYYKATCTTPNIIVTKPGRSEKQIIIGMHYDGDGTGDNGSGVALGLATAKHFFGKETPYTLKFVFFTAEEIGMIGSSYYADNMTAEEIENTLYMINMDSLAAGDHCCLYGGVQDNEAQTVRQTEAYDNAMKLAGTLGLTLPRTRGRTGTSPRGTSTGSIPILLPRPPGIGATTLRLRGSGSRTSILKRRTGTSPLTTATPRPILPG